MQQIEIDFIIRLSIALGLGALVGMEREKSGTDKIVVAGIRTFSLASIAGCILAFLSSQTLNGKTEILFAVQIGIIVFGAFSIMLMYVRHQLKMTGMTTSLALFVTYIMGVLVGYGFLFEGLVIGIATTFLLVSKERLHHISSVLTQEEILGALEFATIAFILLPLTATMNPIYIAGTPLIGRGLAFDPYWILLIVIFVSTISFVSFIVMRHTSARKGIELSGLFGGLVNSEAATISLSNLACKNRNFKSLALAGIILANVTMLLRNLIIAAFAEPTLKVVKIMFMPCLFMAIVNFVFTYSLLRGKREKEHRVEIKSPFAIKPALEFAALFALIAAAAYLATQTEIAGSYISNLGVYLTAVGGFVSSAAVTASLSSLVYSTSISPFIVAETALLACVISTLNKIFLIRLSSRGLARKSVLPFGATAAVGIASMIAIALLFMG